MQEVPGDQHLPETTESREGGRWVPPIVVIVILVAVLVILGIRFL